MERIEKFDDVLFLLNTKAIVFILQKDQLTYFAKNEHQIRVKSDYYNYYINEDDFIHLYQKENFYLYENEKETNEEEARLKDAEYYSWTHK